MNTLPPEVLRSIALLLPLKDVPQAALSSKSLFGLVLLNDASFAREHLKLVSRRYATVWHMLHHQGIRDAVWRALPFSYKAAVLPLVFAAEPLNPLQQQRGVVDNGGEDGEDDALNDSDWEEEQEEEQRQTASAAAAVAAKTPKGADLDDWERWRVSPTLALRLSQYLMYQLPSFDVSMHKNTPLVVACAMGYVDVVKLFLAHPQVDPTDDDNSAVFYAASEGNLEIVSLLLEDARVNAGAFDNQPLMVAMEEGKHSVAQLLLSDANVRRNMTAEHAGYCLYWAAHHGYTDFVESFLAAANLRKRSTREYIGRAREEAKRKGQRGVLRLFDESNIDKKKKISIVLSCKQ